MRILHFSDAHLGAEIHGKTDPETRVHTQLQDFLTCLDFLVQTAIDEQVDLVLFTGDAYHHQRPAPLPQREFIKRLITLSEHGISVLLLAGNHDLPPVAGEASALDIVNVVKIPGVQFVRQPKTVTVMTRKGEVQLVCIPYLPRHALVDFEEERGLDEEGVHRLMVRRTEEWLRRLMRQVVPNGSPVLLAAHLWVEGAEFAGSERVLASEPIVPPSVLRNPLFAYVALGHIHRHQFIGNLTPPIAYAGSLGRLDFGEENQPKGFLLVDLKPRSKGGWEVQDLRFVHTPTRRFVTVWLDLRSEEEPMRAAETALSQNSELDGAVVRVVITVKEHQRDLVNLGRLHELLEKRVNYLAAIRVNIEGAHPTAEVRNEPEAVERLLQQDPVTLLKEWLQEQPNYRDRTERLLRLAQKLLETTDGSRR